VTLDPAVFQQKIQNPVGLLPLTAHRGRKIVLVFIQHRRAGDGLLKALQYLLAGKGPVVIGQRAVKAGMERAQALQHLLPVLAEKRAEKMVTVFAEEHCGILSVIRGKVTAYGACHIRSSPVSVLENPG